jgi:hypothetical protein
MRPKEGEDDIARGEYEKAVKDLVVGKMHQTVTDP